MGIVGFITLGAGGLCAGVSRCIQGAEGGSQGLQAQMHQQAGNAAVPEGGHNFVQVPPSTNSFLHRCLHVEGEPYIGTCSWQVRAEQLIHSITVLAKFTIGHIATSEKS